jgi:endonuclease/exonuclease/phosphatase family metal-dependent hydrolase
VDLRVLTWNLKHGRSVPSAGRDLFDEFASKLAGWEWDVALLQEVPPWWPAAMGSRLGVSHRFVLTSRNALLPGRRWVARRWPDLIKSNGGGSNAILVRGMAIAEHRIQRLATLPERRWLHAVRAEGIWFGNLHCATSPRQAELAGRTMVHWAADAPIVLGGDFNLRSVTLEGYTWAGGSGVDHVLVRALKPVSEIGVLDRGRLSDHAPVLVGVQR